MAIAVEVLRVTPLLSCPRDTPHADMYRPAILTTSSVGNDPMSGAGSTIAMRTSGTSTPHRIFKIVPYAAGGFAVTAPYHSARSGFLAKMPVDYRKGGVSRVSRADMTPYSANDRVKLSYHRDGFAQFSGERAGKILSGRDPATGEPKGLGLLTNPPSQPIKSGPTFAVTVWGIEDFEILSPNKPAAVFEEEDCYFRGTTADCANAWTVEAFVLPRNFWGGVHRQSDKLSITLVFGNFEAPGVVFELRVVDLPGQPVFIGLLVSRMQTTFAGESGFVLSGPGHRFTDGKGEVLMACYPADACGGSSGTASLNYSPNATG
jgi:hypothetical protein